MDKNKWVKERERHLETLAAFERGNRSFVEDERGELKRDNTEERVADLKRKIAELDARIADEDR